MRRLAVFAMICLLVAAGAAYAKDYEVTKKAGEYTVNVKIDRNPPVAGNNNLEIAVKDAAGKAVTDAKVVVEYSMAPMPGMPAANYKTEAAPKGETYKAAMNLSMAGPWSIAIKITHADKTQTAKFTVDAK
jgi:YtkA-like